MPTLKDIMQSDLLTIESDLGDNVVTWKSEDYPCVPSAISNTLELDVGGFSANPDKELVVRKNAFTDGLYPTSKEMVTYKTKQYRILSVTDNANEAFIKLILISDTRGL